MFSDIMYIQQEPFLISVFKPLGFVISTCTSNRKTRTLRIAIKNQVLLLKNKGFFVSRLICDGERGFGAATEDYSK
jgi:hypothetical protein